MASNHKTEVDLEEEGKGQALIRPFRRGCRQGPAKEREREKQKKIKQEIKQEIKQGLVQKDRCKEKKHWDGGIRRRAVTFEVI